MSSGSSSGDCFSTLRASEAALKPVSEVLAGLRTNSSRGLASSEVEERRRLHGLNEFIIKEEDPLWKKYLNQVCS